MNSEQESERVAYDSLDQATKERMRAHQAAADRRNRIAAHGEELVEALKNLIGATEDGAESLADCASGPQASADVAVMRARCKSAESVLAKIEAPR